MRREKDGKREREREVRRRTINSNVLHIHRCAAIDKNAISVFVLMAHGGVATTTRMQECRSASFLRFSTSTSFCLPNQTKPAVTSGFVEECETIF
jgi:hypothetical protein